MNHIKQPFVQSKNHLAKLITGDGFYFDYQLKSINYLLSNIDSSYWNFTRLCDEKKWKYFRVMREPLNRVNKAINEKIFKKYDKEIPAFIFWWIAEKSNVWAAYIHSEFNYNRSYLLLDFSTYFEQITLNDVVNSLQMLWIANEKSAKVIAELCCVVKWKKPQKEWDKVVARGFATSSRLAVYWSLKFFKNLDSLLKKELKWLNPRISIFVDDISISFDNSNREKIDNLKEKIFKLAEIEWFTFNAKKTKVLTNTSNVNILWVLVKRWNIDVTKEFETNLTECFQDVKNSVWDEKERAIRKKDWKMWYKKYVRSFNDTKT